MPSDDTFIVCLNKGAPQLESIALEVFRLYEECTISVIKYAFLKFGI